MSEPLSCVVTVVARKGSATLDDALLTALRRGVGSTRNARWLDAGLSADIPASIAVEALPGLKTCVSSIIGDAAIDFAIGPAAGRRKFLFLADMDSTMIGQECIDELADFAGLKARVSAITERAMQGEIAFKPALRERVALLKGLPLSVVDEVLETRITLTPGGATLIRTLRAHGCYCALVSGGFTLFTGPVAQRLGFDEHRSNRLDVAGDRLSGTVAEPILGRDAKRDRLLALRTALKLDAAATMAVGDGANDLAMLDAAGLGVAFRAKPAVASAAHARIDHTDLTSLLFFQGYERHEFVD